MVDNINDTERNTFSLLYNIHSSTVISHVYKTLFMYSASCRICTLLI